MGMTLSEKILSRHAGRDVVPGEIILADVDAAFTHDSNRLAALEIFKQMNGKRSFDPERVILIIDHHYPAPQEVRAGIHRKMREMASSIGCVLHDGIGICHVLIPEKGHALPGDLVVGTDSHCCTGGALGAFVTGVTSIDMAATMITGKLWFMVPRTIKINIVGMLPAGVSAKDIILFILASVPAGDAAYRAIEFSGPVIDTLSMEARLTLTSLVVEIGAKVGLIAPDRTTIEWVNRRKPARAYTPETPDPDAIYAKEITVDVSTLSPYVATPHYVGNGVPIEGVLGTPIAQGNITSCTVRLEDLRIAASIVKGRKIAPGVRFFIIPSSREVLQNALSEGVISTLMEAGASVGAPSCFGCSSGGWWGVPSDGEAVISTATRNTRGRLGNPQASIYLASTATVAASVLEGRITDPRPYF